MIVVLSGSPRLGGPRVSGLCNMGRIDGPRRYKVEGLPPCPDGTLLCVDGKIGVRTCSFLPM